MIEVGITVRADTLDEIKSKLSAASDLAVDLFTTRAVNGEESRRVQSEETVKSSETTEKVYIETVAVAFDTPDLIRDTATGQIVSGGVPPQQVPQPQPRQ